MLARIQAESAKIAREYKHNAVLALHVLLAWLAVVEKLEHPNKAVVRANIAVKLRGAIEAGLVAEAKGPSLGMSPGARSLLRELQAQYLNAELLKESLQANGISDTDVVISSPAGNSKSEETELDIALAKLDAMIGLKDVKTKMHALVKVEKVRQVQKAQGKKTVQSGLNLIFTGDPGTGKTSIARIVGDIYRGLGILKSGHIVEVSQSDLIAEYVGQTTAKTQKVINKALDGVLFIDEAYALVNKDAGGYGQEAINTLVKAIDDNRDRLAVIVAGYTEEMIPFINANPGLQSRFTKQFYFENYSTPELFEIFQKHSKELGIVIKDDVESLVKRHLDINPTSGANGNGRYVRNLFEMMYDSMAIRALEDGVIEDHEMTEFSAEDVPFSLEKHERPGNVEDVLAELDELIGLDSVKQKLRQIVAVQQARIYSEKAGLPAVTPALNMVFTGPPGTGKTTVARIVARIYQSLGVLNRGQMVETGSQDLIGQYLGQTAPKVVARVKEAMGGVLFIDEAYSLVQKFSNDSDGYGKEAVATLIAQVENLRGQFALICAGYKDEMQAFLDVNPGLKSRIDHVVEFTDYNVDELVTIFLGIAAKQKITVSDNVKTKLVKHFSENETGGAQGNGRYVRKIFDLAYANMAMRAAEAGTGDTEKYLAILQSFASEDIPGIIQAKNSGAGNRNPIGFQANS